MSPYARSIMLTHKKIKHMVFLPGRAPPVQQVVRGFDGLAIDSQILKIAMYNITVS